MEVNADGKNHLYKMKENRRKIKENDYLKLKMIESPEKVINMYEKGSSELFSNFLL